MLKNRICLINEYEDKKYLNILKNFWEKNVGMKTIIVSPHLHDKILSITSHLPHLISFLYIYFIKSKKFKNLKKFSGPYFEDFTRVADNNFKMWTEIFLSNRDEILNYGYQFVEYLNNLLNFLKKSEYDKILKFLKDVKKSYRKVL